MPQQVHRKKKYPRISAILLQKPYVSGAAVAEAKIAPHHDPVHSYSLAQIFKETLRGETRQFVVEFERRQLWHTKKKPYKLAFTQGKEDFFNLPHVKLRRRIERYSAPIEAEGNGCFPGALEKVRVSPVKSVKSSKHGYHFKSYQIEVKSLKLE
jgi:hypothetical protein